ncbi:iron reductase domain protein [Xylaria intraflava]|nr:iron reductase domain protein [Xylaria intraflava]
MYPSLKSAVLSAFTYSALGAARTASRCSTNNVCFQVGVPEASASSGSGNIYLQLRAPTSYSWVSFGTGQQMSGSNIFVLYTDGAGNVTVSARKGTGHTEPKHQTDTQLTLLAGSGVTDNGQTMLANVRCANCESWDGGSLSLTSTSSPFIAAWKAGSPLNSKSADASISRHDSHDQFAFDLTRATITDDQNPFISSNSGSNNGGSNSGNNGGNNGGSTTPSNSGTGNSGSSSVTVPSWIREIPTLASAHGILMSIVMVALYPLGSVLMPLFGNWALHAVWQSISFVAMWAGFAIGVVLAQRTGYDFTEKHAKLGTVVVALLGIQPIGGYIHHRHYLKYQKRGLVSYGHIWYGRILIAIGIINGGLGLQLASASSSLVKVYSALAAIIYVGYIAGAIFAEIRRHRGARLGDSGRKSAGNSNA